MLGISRSSYYEKVKERESRSQAREEESVALREESDAVLEEYMGHPSWGYRKMSRHLLSQGHAWATERRVRRYYQDLGLKGIAPRFKTTRPSRHPYGKYPYLLKDRPVRFPNQVWATDITYIKTPWGMMYYTAVIDWRSRKLLSWRLSDRMDAGFCLDALHEAVMLHGVPAILNTDQGSQYQGKDWKEALDSYGISPSMDGRGRWADNVFCERLWRTLKYEWLFVRDYRTKEELVESLKESQRQYNSERPHQGLDYETPDAVYGRGCFPVQGGDDKQEVVA